MIPAPGVGWLPGSPVGQVDLGRGAIHILGEKRYVREKHAGTRAEKIGNVRMNHLANGKR